MKTFIIISAFLPVFSLQASATPAVTKKATSSASFHSLPLFKALSKAYVYNPEFKSLQAKLRAYDEKIPQALADWRPEISASGGVSQQKDIYYKGFPISGGTTSQGYTSYNLKMIGVEAKQNLFRSGATVANVREAEFSLESERLIYYLKEQEFLFKIISAYAELCTLHDAIKVQMHNEAQNKKIVEFIDARLKEDASNIEALNQAQARLIEAINSRAQAEVEFRDKQESYKKLTGEDFIYGDLSSIFIFLPNLPLSLPQLINLSLKNSFALQASQKEQEALKETLNKMTARLLPSVDASVSATKQVANHFKGTPDWNNFTNSTTNTSNLAAAIKITMPIYEKGVIWSKRREIYEHIQAQRLTIQDLINDIKKNVSQQFHQHNFFKDSLGRFTQQIQNYQVVVTGKEAELRVRTVILLDVLENHQKYIDAQLNLAKAKQNYITSYCRLLFEAGQLTARHLKLNASYYDPKRHYQTIRNRWL